MSDGSGRDPEVARLQAAIAVMRERVRQELAMIGERLHLVGSKLEEAGRALRYVADMVFAFRKEMRNPRDDE